MVRKLFLCLAAVVAIASPGLSQVGGSDGLKFLNAIRSKDNGTALSLMDAVGSTVVNFRDGRGEGALHIAVGRRDFAWTNTLLRRGADPNLAGPEGDSALIIAARRGFAEGADLLLRRGARVDQSNRMGETALIVAVQARQPAVVKRLLEAGANADKTDRAAGLSARDYARRDQRGAELLRLIDTIKPASAKPKVGPGL